ncbi:MAG: hypothetical protein ABW199_04630 [Caulobacterales bacterium]
MRALAALLFALVCAVSVPPASAQGRDNAYVVAGVPAEATADNSAQAQTQAFASAQRIGFERLVRRLAPASDVIRLGVPTLDDAALDRLVNSVEVENERRSGTRYVGRVTVRYNQNAVRTQLRTAGFTLVETRTSPVALIAQAPGLDEQTATLWRQVWTEGGYQTELAPILVAAPLDGAPDWAAAQTVVQGVGAATALYATLRVQRGSATAALVEVGPDNLRRDRGTVTAPIQNNDLRAAFAALAQQTSDILQIEWKARAATGSLRGRISASALYDEQSDWQRIKSGLEAAASTSISEIRIEAVGRTGALVSFSFTGDQSALVGELRRHGVSLENSQIGPVLRVAQR